MAFLWVFKHEEKQNLVLRKLSEKSKSLWVFKFCSLKIYFMSIINPWKLLWLLILLVNKSFEEIMVGEMLIAKHSNTYFVWKLNSNYKEKHFVIMRKSNLNFFLENILEITYKYSLKSVSFPILNCRARFCYIILCSIGASIYFVNHISAVTNKLNLNFNKCVLLFGQFDNKN